MRQEVQPPCPELKKLAIEAVPDCDTHIGKQLVVGLVISLCELELIPCYSVLALMLPGMPPLGMKSALKSAAEEAGNSLHSWQSSSAVWEARGPEASLEWGRG